MTENILEDINNELHLKTIKKIKQIRQKREKKGYIDFNSYNINIFLDNIFNIIKQIDTEIKSKNDIELSFIDRNKFDADICIKIPYLLQKYKGQGYIKDIIPKIIDLIEKSQLNNNIISKIETVGIYINITLNDNFLFNTLNDVFVKKEKYGENDIHKGESIIVDYSSPNVAKHLHAGHIRSTIIGHVLSNLYDANGYYTHRINHINDWGGFGFLIEGYNRWKEKIINFDFENKNDMLFFIYTLYRKGEKINNSKEEFEKLGLEELNEIKKYYGDFDSYEDFIIIFNEYLETSKKRFNELENGKKEIVEIWKQMVKWSLFDFDVFYNLLGIKLDYVIGESFYGKLGVDLIIELEKKGIVILYTQELAKKDIKELENEFNKEKINEKSLKIAIEEINRDIGAYIIPLDNFERFVVLKADKSSIYATRDLGAIKYRIDTFSPSKIIYEVGQEQAEHFDKLFKSASKLGINGIGFSHIYHGFYIDLKTKKKLSSRDGASNVSKLINESIIFFKNKYKNSNFTQKEIDNIAYKLAVGSIIFNDIKSDKKNPVSISSDIQETCEAFEESGGAYVMYSIVRAKSILTKIDNLNDLKIKNSDKLDNIEKIIINEINKYPLIIKLAQENDNPSTLVEFILNLSRYYNSYYNSHRIIDGDYLYENRVKIIKAFVIVLTNAMKICNIEVPERI